MSRAVLFGIFLVTLFLGALSPILLFEKQKTRSAEAAVLFAHGLVWETEGAIFSDPTIRNGEVIPLPDGQYRMFFHQGDQIKSALSPDGRVFAIEEGVRLQGTMPAIIKLPDGRWRMYLQTIDNGIAVFQSAVSSDAFTWTVEEGVRLAAGGQDDPDNIVHPTVVALPEGGYRMYYDGEVRRTAQDFTWRILSATSPDGLAWTKDAGVRINVGEEPLKADLVWSAHAEYYELTQTYQLYFSVQSPEVPDGIYLATSEDGLLFTVSPEPELAPTEESGEFGEGGQLGSYQDPFVLNLDETRRMYYWVNGTGIYSAVLKEESAQENAPEGNLWEKIRALPGKINLKLPQNLELYIVPTILLVIGTVIVVYLWRARLRR